MGSGLFRQCMKDHAGGGNVNFMYTMNYTYNCRMKIIIYCGQKMKRTHIGNFVLIFYWIEPESAPCEGAVLTVIRYKQMFFKNYSNFARIVFIYTTNFTY